MKRLIKGVVSLIVVFSLVIVSCFGVSAANHDDVLITNIIYAGANVDFDTREGWLSDTNQQYVMYYMPGESHMAYAFHISAPIKYIVGDVVNITGTLVLPYDTNFIHFRFVKGDGSFVANSPADLSSGFRTVNLDGEIVKLCDFKYSYTFTAATNCDAQFYIDCNSAIGFIGVLDMDFLLNNDPSIAMKQQTDAITSNQDKNTDKILNSYGDVDADVSDSTGKLDGTMDDINDSTDAALGGKDNDAINKQVDDTLDFDISDIDKISVSKISGFFDDLLNAFGGDYQALLILSLTLGLSAFLIGRRYG